MSTADASMKLESNLRPFPKNRKEWRNGEIVAGILRQSAPAGQALFDKFHPRISGRVRRLLGPDTEWEDVVQQVFLTLIKSVHHIRQPELLDRWIDRITINAVRKEFRRRRRRWYLSYVAEVPEIETRGGLEDAMLFRRATAVLEGMHPEERIAFVLRFVMEEELAPMAQMCGWSLSTTKRRIEKGRDSFLKRAGRDPMLVPLMEGLQDE